MDNNEEAIMFRIWDTNTKKIVASRLEINHADGTREHVEEFALADTSSGWHLRARKPDWDLRIVRACQGYKPGGRAPATFMKAQWYSCNVAGTAGGKHIGGVAVAELVPKTLPALSAAESNVWRPATSQPASK